MANLTDISLTIQASSVLHLASINKYLTKHTTDYVIEFHNDDYRIFIDYIDVDTDSLTILITGEGRWSGPDNGIHELAKATNCSLEYHDLEPSQFHNWIEYTDGELDLAAVYDFISEETVHYYGVQWLFDELGYILEYCDEDGNPLQSDWLHLADKYNFWEESDVIRSNYVST